MGITIDVKRTKFYNELSEDKQKEYFDLKYKKFIPCIDNVYYSCFLEDDKNNNIKLKPLIDELERLKIIVNTSYENVDFYDELQLAPGGFKIYKYRLTNPDLYDIFILDYLPNIDTPRVLVQLRAYGLWIYGVENMLLKSFEEVQSLFFNFVKDDVFYKINISKCRENRIDYCYHTNIIKSPHKEFSDDNLEKSLKTVFNTYGVRGHIDKSTCAGKNVNLVKDYISFGERSSNNIYVRIYNKAFEVCELAYKSFFFEIWYQQGLINAYDKFCFEYAYNKKDYNYIHKAKLEFYILYGSSEEIKRKFKKALDNDLVPQDYYNLSVGVLPDVTTVINIEFETKRKFYYYSDKFIDDVLKIKSEAPHQLHRIFKIIDNRAVFLDYLSSKTIAFYKNDDYSDWWQRLRCVKLDGIKTDDKLVREYAKNLDKSIVVNRAINAVATSALYSNIDGFDFKEDVSDLLSNINDNTIYRNYVKNKQSKAKRLKNML